MEFRFGGWAGLTMVAAFAAGLAVAQSGLPNEPVNLPPADYTGDTFVDNDGCMFVRAGFDGNITWVPRVTRSREPVCGQTPTFAAAPAPVEPEVVATPAPAAEPQTAPVTETEPAPRRIVATPSPAPEPTIMPAPASTETAVDTTPAAPAEPMQTIARQTPSAAPEPTIMPGPVTTDPVRQQAAVPAPRVIRPAPVTTTITTTTTASGGPVVVPAPRVNTTGASTVYTVPPVPVRTTHTRTTAGTHRVVTTTPGSTAPVAAINANRWVLPPSHQGSGLVAPTIPEGFRAAWDDGRLNPMRGWQRPEGIAASEQLWSNTVPRVGQPESTGSRIAVTSTDGLRPVSRDGTAQTWRYVGVAEEGGNTAFLSTRGGGAVAAPTPRVSAGGALIQAGVFGNPSNARNAVARLQASGLPAAVQSRGGNLQAVVVGPFGSQGSANDALRRTRAAGFSDAFLR